MGVTVPDAVRVRVPASTANLGPGFDCLGLAVDLYSDVSIELLVGSASARGPIIETVGGEFDLPAIPSGEGNLVWRAARRVYEVVGTPIPPLRVRQTVGAPLSRGLGSSAAAIVAGMVGANAILGSPLAPDDILGLASAMEGHPDNVAVCLLGGLVAAMVADDRVLAIRHKPAECLGCVFVVPESELPTSQARRALPRHVPLRDAVFNLSRVPFVIDRLVRGDLKGLGEIMADRLHQPYRRELVFGYDAIAADAEASGAAAVCLSGAGPTMLALCHRDRMGGVAAGLRATLAALGIDGRVISARPDLDGARVEVD